MPIVLNPQHMPRHTTTDRTPPQRVAITMGIALCAIGVIGIIVPSFMNMHLSNGLNLIHLLTGGLALWCGLSLPRRAFNFCLGAGFGYGLLGILGFLIGEPGYPSVGHREADQNLFRAIPDVLELGTTDHLIHLFISAFLLFTAYTFRKDRSTRILTKRTL